MDSLSNVLRQPTAKDDKYSRGVVGFITGSIDYPGAALLGVTAALRTGIGMVRYLGPDSVARMLIEVRPEVVLQPGRVQAWVFGSGVADDAEQQARIRDEQYSRVLTVFDAGALDFVDFDSELCHSILTPHAGELVRLLSRFGITVSREEIEANPTKYATEAAKLTNQVVLLKGNVTTVASPGGKSWQTPPMNPALATAGSGDVLAGILGALLAMNAEGIEHGHLSLGEIGLAGADIHSRACDKAAESGPVLALDIANAVRTVVKDVLDES